MSDNAYEWDVAPPDRAGGATAAALGFAAWMLSVEAGVTPQRAFLAMQTAMRAQGIDKPITVQRAAELMGAAHTELILELNAAAYDEAIKQPLRATRGWERCEQPDDHPAHTFLGIWSPRQSHCWGTSDPEPPADLMVPGDAFYVQERKA